VTYRRALSILCAAADPTPTSDRVHRGIADGTVRVKVEKFNVVNRNAFVISSQIERERPLTNDTGPTTIDARCHRP
jgi:hypothetical protein